MKLTPLPLMFLKPEVSFLFGVFSLLLGEIIGLCITDHHPIAHVTTAESLNPKPVYHTEFIIIIFPNVANPHPIYHGKGKL